MKKEYKTIFFNEDDGASTDRLDKVLNTWAEDGFVLHTIIPYLFEGSTTGYTIVFELDVDNN